VTPAPLAAVFVGGFLGTVARAELAEVAATDPGSWPWATFAVNVAACLALGFVATRARDPQHAGRLLWGTGLCGGLSTFATMQFELLSMLDAGHVALAAGYAAASVVAGLAALRVTA